VEDEIGQLADTFNVMADRLRSAFAQVEYERDRVEVLLNDLSEGVLGLSGEGTITIANPAAAILLDRTTLIGESVDAALPADVARLWRDSQMDADFDMVVFAHDDITLEATTYPVGGDADFTSIVVLRDVTAQAKLERARRDLIAKNPDLVKRFLNGLFATIAYMKAHKAETLKVTVDEMHESPAVAEKTYDSEIGSFIPDGTFDPKALAVLKQSFLDMGMLQSEPATDQMLMTQFLPVKP